MTNVVPEIPCGHPTDFNPTFDVCFVTDKIVEVSGFTPTSPNGPLYPGAMWKVTYNGGDEPVEFSVDSGETSQTLPPSDREDKITGTIRSVSLWQFGEEIGEDKEPYGVCSTVQEENKLDVCWAHGGKNWVEIRGPKPVNDQIYWVRLYDDTKSPILDCTLETVQEKNIWKCGSGSSVGSLALYLANKDNAFKDIYWVSETGIPPSSAIAFCGDEPCDPGDSNCPVACDSPMTWNGQECNCPAGYVSDDRGGCKVIQITITACWSQSNKEQVTVTLLPSGGIGESLTSIPNAHLYKVSINDGAAVELTFDGKYPTPDGKPITSVQLLLNGIDLAGKDTLNLSEDRYCKVVTCPPGQTWNPTHQTCPCSTVTVTYMDQINQQQSIEVQLVPGINGCNCPPPYVSDDRGGCMVQQLSSDTIDACWTAKSQKDLRVSIGDVNNVLYYVDINNGENSNKYHIGATMTAFVARSSFSNSNTVMVYQCMNAECTSYTQVGRSLVSNRDIDMCSTSPLDCYNSNNPQNISEPGITNANQFENTVPMTWHNNKLTGGCACNAGFANDGRGTPCNPVTFSDLSSCYVNDNQKVVRLGNIPTSIHGIVYTATYNGEVVLFVAGSNIELTFNQDVTGSVAISLVWPNNPPAPRERPIGLTDVGSTTPSGPC